jgi:hypothetical protein
MTDEATQSAATQDATSTQSGASATQTQVAGQQTASAGQGAGSAVERPAHVPESLWDAATGAIKTDDALKQLSELQAFKAATDSKLAAVPEKPDGYELKLPPDLKIEGYELDPNNPMVGFGRTVAHALKLDQSGFEAMVGMFAQHEVAMATSVAEMVGRQMEALGPKHAERVGAVKNFLVAKYGERAPALLSTQLQLKEGVELLERIMRDGASGGMPSFNQGGRAGGAPQMSEEAYAKLSFTEKMDLARKRTA